MDDKQLAAMQNDLKVAEAAAADAQAKADVAQQAAQVATAAADAATSAVQLKAQAIVDGFKTYYGLK